MKFDYLFLRKDLKYIFISFILLHELLLKLEEIL